MRTSSARIYVFTEHRLFLNKAYNFKLNRYSSFVNTPGIKTKTDELTLKYIHSMLQETICFLLVCNKYIPVYAKCSINSDLNESIGIHSTVTYANDSKIGKLVIYRGNNLCTVHVVGRLI